MNSLKNLFTTITVTFFLTLLFNYTISYFSESKGTIGISNTIILENLKYRIITIDSNANVIINGLIFEVPSDTLENNISSTDPIEIKFLDNLPSSKYKYLQISNIPPQKNTKIAIKFQNKNDSSDISPINYKSSGFDIINENHTKSIFQKIFLNVIIIASVYTIIFGIYSYINYKHKNELDMKFREKISSVEKKSEELSKRYDQLRDANEA